MTIWEQIVNKKEDWIGGELQETEDSFPQLNVDPPHKTMITDITFKPNGESFFFMVHGKDYDCGFDITVGGILGKSNGEEGYLHLIGYGGHEFKIKQRV